LVLALKFCPSIPSGLTLPGAEAHKFPPTEPYSRSWTKEFQRKGAKKQRRKENSVIGSASRQMVSVIQGIRFGFWFFAVFSGMRWPIGSLAESLPVNPEGNLCNSPIF
jgi:hypothetical protein